MMMSRETRCILNGLTLRSMDNYIAGASNSMTVVKRWWRSVLWLTQQDLEASGAYYTGD